MNGATPALELRDLSVAYRTQGVEQLVLRGVSFAIAPGETYGLVGESGCGKSTVALAALRSLARTGSIRSGRVLVDGQDVAGLGPTQLRQLRLTKVSMVYQDPGRALNPSMTVARQVAEVFELLGFRHADALQRAEAMLVKVRIPGAGRVMKAFPHQLSGGMQQRVVIAMALAKNPRLLVLDEPTTGLDATVEADVLDLIEALKHEFATSILFISHNLAVIERMCGRIGVLYAGSLVEEGPGADVLARPLHPYTMRLLRCRPAAGRRKSDGRLDTIPGFLPPLGSVQTGCVFAPRCDFADAACRTPPPPIQVGRQTARCHHIDRAAALGRDAAEITASAPPAASRAGRPALHVTGVSKTFRVGSQPLRAVSNVSLTLRTGETLGLVGESGSGKTTLARLLLGLIAPDPGGTVELDGQPVAGLAKRRSRAEQKALQIVFQNPDSALNRSHTVRRLIERSLQRLGGLFGRQRAERLTELVAAVRLTQRHLAMRPRQLSGGLKQRVAIARAFAGDPRVVICDEPTSALDVSVQAAILNLLADLQATAGVSYLFISHDLGVVRYLSDRIAVLYLGRLMEFGPAEDVFNGPHHPYTEALLSAVPGLAGLRDGGPGRIRLSGELPSPLAPPPGCVFNSRCPRKIGTVCETTEPELNADGAHQIRCHLPREALGRRGGEPPTPVAEDRSHAPLPV